MDGLIEFLKEKQSRRGESQREFSEFLDISESALSRLYSSQRGIGGRLLAKILIRYPDVASFFDSNHANSD